MKGVEKTAGRCPMVVLTQRITVEEFDQFIALPENAN